MRYDLVSHQMSTARLKSAERRSRVIVAELRMIERARKDATPHRILDIGSATADAVRLAARSFSVTRACLR